MRPDCCLPGSPGAKREAASAPSTSGFKECQQIGVELFLVRGGQAVGCAGVYLQGRVLDEFRGGQSRSADRHNLVVVTVNDKRRHVELLKVLGKIRLGERFDAVEGVLVTGLHPLQPEPVNHALRNLRAWPVEAEERAAGEILVELRSVGDGAEADLVEYLNRQAAGIGGGLQQARWGGPN